MGCDFIKRIVVIFMIMIASIIGIWLLLARNNEPKSEDVKQLLLIKMEKSLGSVVGVEDIYAETNTGNIKEVLGAISKRRWFSNNYRGGVEDYRIEIDIKHAGDEVLEVFDYNISIEENRVFISLPSKSNKCYELKQKAAEVLLNYISNLSLEDN